MTLSHLEQEALKLSEEERATLAEHLLSSLGDSNNSSVEDRWYEEAEWRYQEFKAGRMTARPAADVLQDLLRTIE